MAKGVVAYPVINNTISFDYYNIMTYGVSSVRTGFTCVGQSNSASICNMFCGRLTSNYGVVAVNTNNSVEVWGTPDNGSGIRRSIVSGPFNESGVSGYRATIADDTFAVADVNNFDVFESLEEMTTFVVNLASLSINYISGAITVAGPRFTSTGSTVTAFLSIPNGISVTTSDISITKSGIALPLTYSNGVLTFTV